MNLASVGRAIALVVLAVSLSACSGGADEPSPDDLPYSEFTKGDELPTSGPECYGGRGSAADGSDLVAALRLRRDGADVWGSYTYGRSTDQIVTYLVTGSVEASRLDAEFRSQGAALQVSGRFSSAGVDLFDSSRTLPVTRLAADCG